MTQQALDIGANEIERKYREWVAAHPRVFALFEKFALEMLATGRRFGVKALAERVRWEVRTTWVTEPNGPKINNNFTAYIARDLVVQHPELGALIELRKVRADDDNPWRGCLAE